MSGALQRSQQLESHAAKQSAEIAFECKRRLLIYLSAWLLALDSANTLTAAEREEVQKLTRVSLVEWIQLQTTAVQTESDLKEAEGKEKEALALLRKKVPVSTLTTLTKILAGAEAKTQIHLLQEGVSAARRSRESLSVKLQQNLVKRQAFGEAFFKDCIRQWDKLALTQALGKEAGEILSHMTLKTNAIWVGHQKQQEQELAQVAKLFDELRDSYKNNPTSPSQKYEAVTPQKQSAAHLGQGNSYDFTEE